MQWTSISELVKDLNLESDSSDESSIKSEIRKRLSLIHPDKNNGQFISDGVKEQFYVLTQALDFLEVKEKESQSLIAITQSSALIQAITNALVPTKEERLNQERNDCRS